MGYNRIAVEIKRRLNLNDVSGSQAELTDLADQMLRDKGKGGVGEDLGVSKHRDAH